MSEDRRLELRLGIRALLLAVVVLTPIPVWMDISRRAALTHFAPDGAAGLVPIEVGKAYVINRSTPWRQKFETNTVLSVSNGWVRLLVEEEGWSPLEMDLPERIFAVCVRTNL